MISQVLECDMNMNATNPYIITLSSLTWHGFQMLKKKMQNIPEYSVRVLYSL